MTMANSLHADLSSTLQARADVVRKIEENSAAAARVARENASKEAALRAIEGDVQRARMRAEGAQAILKKALAELGVEEAENFRAVDAADEAERDLAQAEEDLDELLKRKEEVRAKFLADHTEIFVDEFSELASIASGGDPGRDQRLLQNLQREKEDLAEGHRARLEALAAEEEEASNALEKVTEEEQRAADELAHCKLELAKIGEELEAEELSTSDEDSFNTSVDDAMEGQAEKEKKGGVEEEEDVIISRGGDMIANLVPGSP